MYGIGWDSYANATTASLGLVTLVSRHMLEVGSRVAVLRVAEFATSCEVEGSVVPVALPLVSRIVGVRQSIRFSLIEFRITGPGGSRANEHFGDRPRGRAGFARWSSDSAKLWLHAVRSEGTMLCLVRYLLIASS
jgi:hypothetical protein